MQRSEYAPHLPGVLEIGGHGSGTRFNEDRLVEILTRGLSLALS